jgi:hypothetical protein
MAQDRQPTRHKSRVDRHRRCGGHEYASRLDHVYIHDSVNGGAREVERSGVDQLCRLRGERHEDCTDDRRCAEQHAEEQEAASEKHSRKKPVFQLAKAVAQDADEP